jgi:hypothetical protein
MQEAQGNIIDQVRLVQEYWPLITIGRQALAESDPYKRAMIIADGVEWMAGKSRTGLDDEAVRLLTELLRTPQGEQLIRWALHKAEAIQ